MANLTHEEVSTDLKGLLNKRPEREDARIDEAIKFATRDIISVAGAEIGEKIVKNLVVTHIDGTSTASEQMFVKLPEDVQYIKQLWVNATEVKLLKQEDWLKYLKSGTSVLTQPYLGRYTQQEDGTQVVELYPQGTAFAGQKVEVLYQASGDNVNVIPRRWKNLILLGAAKHYVFWESKQDRNVYSKFEREYMKELAKFNDAQIDATGTSRRVTEVVESKFLTSFNDLVFNNSIDTGV